MANTAKIQERRINYKLTTGANWVGPIKTLSLELIRKRGPLGFCSNDVKSVSPTVVEFTAKDFTPEKDRKNPHCRQI
jgi:hypothetical protein